MKKVLLIGYGNPLRADDGLGGYAARRIAATLGAANLAVLTPHQLTPDLAAPIHDAHRVIFVDASIQEPPGTIRVHPIATSALPQIVLAHCLAPGSLLALAKQLYGRCPSAVLVSMGARCFGFGKPFSSDVMRAFPALIARLERLIGHREPFTEPTRVGDERPASGRRPGGGAGR
jgi:hydrogenase maturation protease